MGNVHEVDFSSVDPSMVAIDSSCKPIFTGSNMEEHLIFLRDAFKDEIPGFAVHSNYRDSNYKVRGNWWQGLIFSLEAYMDSNEFPDEQTDEVFSLINHCLEHKHGHRTRQDEINWANRVINILVKDYEDSHPELKDNPPYTLPDPELCL